MSNTLAWGWLCVFASDRDFSRLDNWEQAQSTLVNSGLVVDGQRPIHSGGCGWSGLHDPRGGNAERATVRSSFADGGAQFQIVHSGVSAEVGGTNAGFINIATKEGSNKYGVSVLHRASGIYFARHLGAARQHTNEFGGSIGGPIKKKGRALATLAWNRTTSTLHLLDAIRDQVPASLCRNRWPHCSSKWWKERPNSGVRPHRRAAEHWDNTLNRNSTTTEFTRRMWMTVQRAASLPLATAHC